MRRNKAGKVSNAQICQHTDDHRSQPQYAMYQWRIEGRLGGAGRGRQYDSIDGRQHSGIGGQEDFASDSSFEADDCSMIGMPIYARDGRNDPVTSTRHCRHRVRCRRSLGLDGTRSGSCPHRSRPSPIEEPSCASRLTGLADRCRDSILQRESVSSVLWIECEQNTRSR
jgi:hypothetical protein